MANESENPKAKLLEVTEEKGKRPITAMIILIVVVLFALWGLFQLQRVSNKTTDNKKTQSKQVSLTDEQRQTLEAEAADIEGQISKLPENAPAEDKYKLYVKLASVKDNLGLYEEAIAALDKVKDENQNQPALWQRYALIYRDMGDLDKARENAKRALDLDKTVPQYWLTYIEVSSSESADAVKALYNEALQNTENNVGIITAYAIFLEKIGDKQGAIAQWQKAGEIFPQGKGDYDAEIARLQGQ